MLGIEYCSILPYTVPCRYGQLSGMVEPLAGLFGTVAVVVSAYIFIVFVLYVCMPARVN